MISGVAWRGGEALGRRPRSKDNLSGGETVGSGEGGHASRYGGVGRPVHRIIGLERPLNGSDEVHNVVLLRSAL